MKRIMAVMMVVVCLLGITSVANAGVFDVVPLYVSAGPAYGWDLKAKQLVDENATGKEAWGYDLKLGIDLLPYLTVEREYLELNRFEDKRTFPDSYYPMIVASRSDFKIWVTNLKLRYPLKMKNVKAVPFFTLGGGYADMESKDDINFPLQNRNMSLGFSNSYPCAKTGMGVDVETRHLRLSLEYSYLEIRNNYWRGKDWIQNGYTAYVIVSAISYKF
jgi:hypothetical protein